MNKDKSNSAKNKRAKADGKKVIIWIALGIATLLILGVSFFLIWFVIRRGIIWNQFDDEVEVSIDEDQAQTSSDQREEYGSDSQEPEEQGSQAQGNQENEHSDADNSDEYLDVSPGMYVYDDGILTITMPTNPDQYRDLKVKLETDETVSVDFDVSTIAWPKATVSGDTFEMKLVYPYEAFSEDLDNPVLVDSGTQFGEIYRIEISEENYQYFSDPTLEGSCNVLGDTISSPCGMKLLMDQEDSLISLDLRCESDNIQKCDDMVKSLEVRWEETL